MGDFLVPLAHCLYDECSLAEPVFLLCACYWLIACCSLLPASLLTNPMVYKEYALLKCNLHYQCITMS